MDQVLAASFGLSFALEYFRTDLLQCLEKQAINLGLTLPEYRILWLASKHPGLTLSDAVVISSLDFEELINVVEDLQADGLVLDQSSKENGRLVILPSDRGKMIMENAPHCAGDFCRFKSLELADLVNVTNSLHKILIQLYGEELVTMLMLQF